MTPTTVEREALRDRRHLVAGSVDLWLVDLSAPGTADDLSLLDTSERERAGRFLIERDRRRFVNAHAALRRILSRYVGRAASALRFELEVPHGKPVLVDAPLHWNLAHSEDHAVVGVAAAAVGVDIEALRDRRDVLAMAQRHFNESEVQALRARLPADRGAAFLCGWTRKEACLKAVGIGLRVDTRGLGVGIEPAPKDVRMQLGRREVRLRVQSVSCRRDLLVAVAQETHEPNADVGVRLLEESVADGA